MTQVTEPFPIFYDNDGTPLDDGMIYVGQANQDPRVNPVTVYTDEARTIPIAQPIRTLGGRPAYQGAPINLYVAEAAYSIAVQNRFGTPIVSAPDVSMSAEDFSFIQSGAGAVARTVQSKLRDTVSVKDFGAVGNGIANDTAGITAADAVAGKIYASAGTYDTTLAATALRGPFYGEGQIRDVANNKRAPYFSAVAAAPASFGNFESVETSFNGDLSGNQFAIEHRVTGAATLGQPTSGYLYRPECMPVFGYLYNESGWNNSTSGNGGRTGVAFQRVMVYQAGQGDAVCYNASAFVVGTKAGSTDFLANPAAVLFNGDIAGGTAGVYLNAGEFALRDNGVDMAGIGWVVNLYRDNATGAKGAFWAGFQAQSQGTVAANHAFGALGKFNVGLEATSADFGANNALVSGKAGQRIYLNNASSNGRYTTSYNGDYIEYSSGNSAINIVAGGNSSARFGSTLITFNQRVSMTLGIVLNFADDAAAAAGGLAVGDVYRTGSALKVRAA